MSHPISTILRPDLGSHLPTFEAFCRHVSTTIDVADDKSLAIGAIRKELRAQQAPNDVNSLKLLAAQSVVLDLVAQGRRLSIGNDGTIALAADASAGKTVEEEKARVRDAHLVNRAEQLAEPSVIEFISGLEKLRLTTKGWRSIFSLMRDGRDLASELGAVESVGNSRDQVEALRRLIRPYIQFVEAGAVCEHTGLRLQDIWRYFRHTWITEYKSLPGRSIQVLIRDAAAENHPVIGIAALGSSVVQHTRRDQWIGWDPDTLLDRMIGTPSKRWGEWILRSLEHLFTGIYTQDLRDEGAISLLDLKHPSEKVIARLRHLSTRAMEQHRRFPHAAMHKHVDGSNNRDWSAQATTNLFKAKRCDVLADLLEIRVSLEKSGLKSGTLKELRAALPQGDFRKAVRRLVQKVKGETVGSSMMDIVVCGAIAPYNHILGGKLVCALMFSPEIAYHYREKYEDQDSLIASAMKGRAVNKSANLVLLGTTSLYGVGSSQYNRIRIPLREIRTNAKAGQSLEYVDLGATKGYGSYHISKDTIELFDLFLSREANGRRVNSIFGEGVNPLMRKIRDGLQSLGLPSDQILRHGNARIVYGIPLASNYADVLLGLSDQPKYLMPQSAPKKQTERLAEFWLRRWVLGRICRPGVLEAVASHSLAYPVRHGARVPLPEVESDQLDLQL